ARSRRCPSVLLSSMPLALRHRPPSIPQATYAVADVRARAQSPCRSPGCWGTPMPRSRCGTTCTSSQTTSECRWISPVSCVLLTPPLTLGRLEANAMTPKTTKPCVVAGSLDLRADVAQLVEHFTRNEGVPGSSPGVGSPLGTLHRRGFRLLGARLLRAD